MEASSEEPLDQEIGIKVSNKLKVGWYRTAIAGMLSSIPSLSYHDLQRSCLNHWNHRNYHSESQRFLCHFCHFHQNPDPKIGDYIGNFILVIVFRWYRLASQPKAVRYVYIPSSMLESNSFNVDDVFSALRLSTPNLMFRLNSCEDTPKWNVRLPAYKQNLSTQTASNGSLVHYQGVLRENTKRLLRGTATACQQAGAVFWIIEEYNDTEPVDYASEWVSEVSNVPLVCLAGFHTYHPEVVKSLMDHAQNYAPNMNLEDEEIKKITRVDDTPFLNGQIPIKRDKKGEIMDSIPAAKCTHLILSDDQNLLEMRFQQLIPTGLIVVNGGPLTTAMFCDGVHKGNPIFLFKNTGSTADLACEMLKKVDTFLAKKRSNPNVRPDQPFKTEIPRGYVHPRWLSPFQDDNIKSCRLLNILIENFPDRYNPASILQIDMFNTSEEKLQDQLTKTMSVVFEGVAELGGQSLETRRLTYAWRLHHLLTYNSSRERIASDILQFFIIFFTMAATIASVLYVYYNTIVKVCQATSLQDDSQNAASTEPYRPSYVLIKLNLLLPLAATILRGIAAYMNPLQKALALKFASMKVESEIYMYRTKIGKYNMRKANSANQASSSASGQNSGNSTNNQKKEKSEDAQQGAGNPRKLFSEALSNIWLDLSSSDISKASLINPPVGTDPMDSINTRLHSNLRAQKLLTQNLESQEYFLQKKRAQEKKDNKKKTHDLIETPSTWFSFFCCCFLKSQHHHHQPQQSGSNNNNTLNENQDPLSSFTSPSLYDAEDEEAAKSETGGGASSEIGFGNEDSASQFGDSKSQFGSGSMIMENSSSSPGSHEHHESHEKNEEMIDDGTSTLTADEYVKIRMLPIMAQFSSRTPSMARRVSSVTIIVITLSVCSSVFSSFKLVSFIPIVLAFLGAMTAWMGYKQTEQRLVQTNGAVHQLHQLLIWWDSLGMIEKRVSTNKELLVLTTESVIQSQVAHYSSNARTTDEEKEDESK